MQVLVMNLVLCFYFVNFSTTNNMCMCVNFAAFINREVGKVKLKFIKKNVYFTIHYAGLLLCTQLWVWLMHLCIDLGLQKA